MQSLRTLLGSIVDYAGLFPPAGLDMARAAVNYCRYRSGEHAWMLGAFVVPAMRLGELVATMRSEPEAPSDPWPLSVLVGSDITSDLGQVDALAGRRSGVRTAPGTIAGVVEALELRADSPQTIGELGRVLPKDVPIYWELPTGSDPTPYVEGIARLGHRAKIRTGGLNAEAFPEIEEILRFIVTCRNAGVMFKATAGLHHPIRGCYRLTYESDSPSAMMYGYLNVFLSAAVVAAGLGEDTARRVLTETDRAAFGLEPQAVLWRGRRFDLDSLRRLRKSVAVSFGSCSFEEPVDELKGIGNL